MTKTEAAQARRTPSECSICLKNARRRLWAERGQTRYGAIGVKRHGIEVIVKAPTAAQRGAKAKIHDPR